MYNGKSKEEIVEIVTKQVFDEIQNSTESLSTEDIQKKINEKLNIIFDDTIKKHLKPKEDIDLVENAFGTNLEEDSYDTTLESEINEKDEVLEDENDSFEEEIEEEFTPKEKEPFFKEIKDIYRDELQNSIECFKGAFDSFRFIKKTSIFEKILIFLFLFIPAILGGLLTLLLILVVLMLWQISIILKVLLKFLDKAESGFAEKIRKVKKKITDYKNSGSFFKKLLFSNALYSIVMINGIMYLLIKGMKIPLKAAYDAEKIIANMLSKVINPISTGLRGPSQLALNNALGANALAATKTKSKEKDAKAKKIEGLEKALKQPRKKSQAKKQEQKKEQDKKIQEKDQKKLQEKEVKKDLKDQQNKNIELKANAPLTDLEKMAGVKQEMPTSSKLSDPMKLFDRDLLRNMIAAGLSDKFRENLGERIAKSAGEIINNLPTNGNTDSRPIAPTPQPLPAEKDPFIAAKQAEAKLTEQHRKEEISGDLGPRESEILDQKLDIASEHGEKSNRKFDEIIKQDNPGITEKQLFDSAIDTGYRLDAEADVAMLGQVKNIDELEKRERADLDKEGRDIKNNYPEVGDDFDLTRAMKEYKIATYGNENHIFENKEQMAAAMQALVSGLESNGKDLSKVKGGFIVDMVENELAWQSHQQTKKEIDRRKGLSSHVNIINQSSGQGMGIGGKHI